MIILFDLTYINPSSSSGVVVYSYRLLSGIIKLELTDHFVLLANNRNNHFLQKKFPEFKVVTLNMKQTPFLDKLYFVKGFFYKKALNKIIETHAINLFFSPYLAVGGLFTSKVMQVGVLHDAQSYILQGEKGLKGRVLKCFMVDLYNKVSHLVTISQYAKSSILKEIPKLTTPISVIYNSVVVSKPNSIGAFKPHLPYILFVNTLMPYKNLETLVKAFGILKNTIKHNLIIKAKKLPYWNCVIEPLIKKYNIEDRVFLIEDNYSDIEMATLYAKADLFVSPSLMEGFGFTPIEAALHKIPVISSKESALYETTLGLLNYYEPATDFNKLSEKIYGIINNKPSIEYLLTIGKQLEEAYSPLKQAELFVKLFKEQLKK